MEYTSKDGGVLAKKFDIQVYHINSVLYKLLSNYVLNALHTPKYSPPDPVRRLIFIHHSSPAATDAKLLLLKYRFFKTLFEMNEYSGSSSINKLININPVIVLSPSQLNKYI